MASKPPTTQASEREARLSKLLQAYIKGDKSPKTAKDGKLLLEAISSQDDRASCAERLVASKDALESLKLALRFEKTTEFFNTTLKDFLEFLQDPAIAVMCAGEVLRQLLTIVVCPETVWSALVAAHTNRQLNPEGELGFAWLLLQLTSWVDDPPINVGNIARDLTQKKTFLEADDRDLRTIGYRIAHVLDAKKTVTADDGPGPGGRHDNDHANFRRVTIFPTDDELMSTETSFYRPADAIAQIPFAQRPGVHLDNQFRLLREDFLAELKEDVNASQNHAKNRRPRTRLRALSLAGAHCGDRKYRTPFALTLSVRSGLEELTRGKKTKNARRAFLKNNPKFLKHQSFGYVVDQERLVTFASLLRVEDLLVPEDEEEEPLVVLRTPDRAMFEKLLSTLWSSTTAIFVMIDTPVFAYEPVLRCLQSTVEVPLWEELFALSGEEVEAAVRPSEVAPLDLVDDIEADRGRDLQPVLSLLKSVKLDDSQSKSLVAGLRQSVSLIQGPPGTGKSFIGALLTQAMVKHTSETMLVICYTNHALDQFLEDLLDIGIPADYMVRLGAKCTPRTESLQLSKQSAHGRHPFGLINALNDDADMEEESSRHLLSSLQNFRPDRRSLMEELEFSDVDSDFHAAFQLPDLDPDDQLVGEGGKKVGEFYLYDRWRNGHDAGVLISAVSAEHEAIWKMNKAARASKIRTWEQALLQERISGVGSHVESYNRTERTLRDAWDQKTTRILQSKRIIACTTTAAAKYTKHLHSATPGIVIVEEAGEILESHVLTAMTPNTKQLVLIGDHQQLRPKVNNYALTVEKGEGYDLNRSLFERLIRAGIPHTTLCQQHRMCPEISSLVRQLTYPDLIDAPSTLNRDPIKGIQGRVIFIDHKYPELAASQIADRHDQGTTTSKENAWEAAMVLKIVRYMAQQGYGTDKQVVLTPYLGQLNRLRKELATENDPVLNDLDAFELIKAGLMTPATASSLKRPIRLSTVDCYQGEESDIVIASLTRSNSSGDIGFMTAPERLNVLLSRARKALIIIGNSSTFLASRRGADTWRPFFKLLTEKNDIHDGLPVKCEQHPDRQNVLSQPADFDQLCPDGGCSAPCGSKLGCGLHDCPQRCHALTDHSKMPCEVLLEDECPRKHKLSWRCSDVRPPTCRECDVEDAIEKERQERDAELDEIRQQKQAAYAAQLAEIQDEIDASRRRMREQVEDEDREIALRQRRQDLDNVRIQSDRIAKSKDAAEHTSSTSGLAKTSPDTTAGAPSAPNASNSSNTSSNGPGVTPTSTPTPTPTRPVSLPPAPVPTVLTAQQVWDAQKWQGAPPNRYLDELMPMIGLESVKEAFLEIKAKVELTVRQNASLNKERFGVSFLGNPGTGKTTVARLYAGFLTSVGALPGATFVETTGAKLANEGVDGCKKILATLLQNGGGAVFIDEAYQLTSGNNPGGLAVLDFLLPEVENLTGKVVFILAGYNRNMETFFAHNPGLPSRFPRKIQFADYEDAELLKIFQYGIDQKYKLRMQLEDGIGGLYCRIVSRRIGRGRGTEGFGNARAVENTLSRVTDRQAKRIEAERRAGTLPDDFWLTSEDMIGPEPAGVLQNNKSWKALQQLTGLTSVKESISALFDSLRYNYERELQEKPIMDFSLNKVFLGSPGTGKTTVAKLYGRILADIGMLSTDEGKCMSL
jgi:DNA replication protein DnaC